MMNL
ncbi:hypothetical protein N7501_002604 [Penicillium viridicatum]|jgi:hypothetical protein